MLLTRRQIVLCFSVKEGKEMSPRSPKLLTLVIKSPFTLLSCKATPANIFVPPYAVERGMARTPLDGCRCDNSSSTQWTTLTSRYQTGPPENVNSTPANQSSAENSITPPNFGGITADIKQPAQAHLYDWGLASEVSATAVPCRAVNGTEDSADSPPFVL